MQPTYDEPYFVGVWKVAAVEGVVGIAALSMVSDRCFLFYPNARSFDFVKRFTKILLPSSLLPVAF